MAPPKRKKKHDLSGVGSLGLTAGTPLISHEFNAFMSDLLRHRAKDLYRSKGVLAFVEEGDHKFIFQGVHEQIQYTTAVEPWGKDEPCGKLPSPQPKANWTPPPRQPRAR